MVLPCFKHALSLSINWNLPYVFFGVLGIISIKFVGPTHWSYPLSASSDRFHFSYAVTGDVHAPLVHDYSFCYDITSNYFFSLTSYLWVGTSLIQFSCPKRSFSKLFYCCFSFISFIFLYRIISSYWSAIYCFYCTRLYRL